MTVVSMNYLLESGVHFGHQKRIWNTKMKVAELKEEAAKRKLDVKGLKKDEIIKLLKK